MRDAFLVVLGGPVPEVLTRGGGQIPVVDAVQRFFAAMEPAITKTVEDLRAERGARPLTEAEFDELFGDLPTDGEG